MKLIRVEIYPSVKKENCRTLISLDKLFNIKQSVQLQFDLFSSKRQKDSTGMFFFSPDLQEADFAFPGNSAADSEMTGSSPLKAKRNPMSPQL